MQKLNKSAIGFTAFVFLLFTFLILADQALAESKETVTYEGKIQGLNCVFNHTKCPTEDLDMYIALESDFVLVLPDGQFFLLHNINRMIKARYLTRQVRIRGQQKGNIIWVSNLEVKEGNKYKTVWNYAQQERRRTEGD
jgi:hypothetical protein